MFKIELVNLCYMRLYEHVWLYMLYSNMNMYIPKCDVHIQMLQNTYIDIAAESWLIFIVLGWKRERAVFTAEADILSWSQLSRTGSCCGFSPPTRTTRPPPPQLKLSEDLQSNDPPFGLAHWALTLFRLTFVATFTYWRRQSFDLVRGNC